MTSHSAAALGIDIREIDRRLAENWSLPTRFYSDPDIFNLELEAIFARRWQFFCPLHKVRNPGDVAVRRIGRLPVAVVRDHDGRLNGFLNVCRHRGYTVVEKDKRSCVRLACRYHGWSYNLDGSLAHAPDAAGEAGFCSADLGLRRVAVEEWGAMVLVHPDPDAASLRTAYPEMFRTARETGFDIDADDWIPYREVVYDIPTNWKLWYDNGTECYHCPNIHSESFGKAFNVDPGLTDMRLGEGFTSYTFTGRTERSANDLTANSYISFQLFPGMTCITQDEFMHMTGMTPLEPGLTRHTAYYMARRGTDEERIDGWFRIWDDTYREDNEVTAVQYENLKCARQPYNRYVAGREAPAQHMNAMVWKDCKAALLA